MALEKFDDTSFKETSTVEVISSLDTLELQKLRCQGQINVYSDRLVVLQQQLTELSDKIAEVRGLGVVTKDEAAANKEV